jgi:cellulose biosynthesis protein BcsQ
LRRASLGEFSYQEFPAQLKVYRGAQSIEANSNGKKSAAPEIEQPAKPIATEISSEQHTNRRPVKNQSTQENGSTELREERTNRQRQAKHDNSWSALDTLFSRHEPEFDFIESITSSVKVPTIFVSAVMGGVGSTTLTATLGRCLAGSGDRMAIAETEDSLILPYYFSARETTDSDVLHFEVADSRQIVRVVKGLGKQSKQGGDPEVLNQEAEAALFERVRQSAEASDRMIFDASRLNLNGLISSAGPQQQILIPIVADFGCALNVLALEERLKTEEAISQRTILPFYVFNKFDHALALHRDIEALLKGALGNRLLKVIVRRSDSVSEALAKGMTVVDYCPGAGIVQDFQQLAEWVRNVNPRTEPETGRT